MSKVFHYSAKMLSLLMTAVLCTGCTIADSNKDSVIVSEAEKKAETSQLSNDSEASSLQQSAGSALEMDAYTNIDLSKADLKDTWDDNAVQLHFSKSEVVVQPQDAVSLQDRTLRITQEGVYVCSGVWEDGCILVELPDEQAKAQIVLNGVSITSKTTAPIQVRQADKVILTLAPDTTNFLTDAEEYSEFYEENEPNACIFSKEDLTINGSGHLQVTANWNHGIRCKNDLRIVNGSVTVNAANHAIKGDDSVVMVNGSLTLNAKGDGIKTDTIDEDGKGYIDMEGGRVSVVAEQDAVDAAIAFVMIGGALSLKSGGGIANAPSHSDQFMHGGWNDWFTGNDTDDTTVSTKGIKAGALLAVTGGTIDVESADDAMHSNGDVSLTGGKISLSAGDDGIHADQELIIDQNTVLRISESYEGIEAYHININGGEIHVNAADDGLNAAGGDTASSMVVPDGDMSLPDGEIPPNRPNGSFGNGMQEEFGGRPPEGFDGGMQGEFGGRRPGGGPQGGFGGGSQGGFGGGMQGGFGGFAAGSGEIVIGGGYLYINASGDGIDSNGNIAMTDGCVIVCGPTNSANGALDCGDRQNTITISGGTLIALGATGMMETPEANYIATGSLQAQAGTLIVVTNALGEVLAALETPKQAAGIVFSCNGASDGYIVYTGGSYEGTRNADGFGTGGTYDPGAEICSGGGSFDISGMGGFGGEHKDF